MVPMWISTQGESKRCSIGYRKKKLIYNAKNGTYWNILHRVGKLMCQLGVRLRKKDDLQDILKYYHCKYFLRIVLLI